MPAGSDLSRIALAEIPDDLDVIRALFLEYSSALGIDLCFQGFEAELAALPGKYAAPAGRLLLAWESGHALGCVALRPVAGETGACEMKRLYLRPAARGRQLGRRLAERICAEARAAGYRRILLDTLPGMAAAQALYASLGFQPVPAYVHNPLDGVVYLGKAL